MFDLFDNSKDAADGMTFRRFTNAFVGFLGDHPRASRGRGEQRLERAALLSGISTCSKVKVVTTFASTALWKVSDSQAPHFCAPGHRDNLRSSASRFRCGQLQLTPTHRYENSNRRLLALHTFSVRQVGPSRVSAWPSVSVSIFSFTGSSLVVWKVSTARPPDSGQCVASMIARLVLSL